MGSPEMQVALSKIRPHTSSNLAHQKKLAQLLVALESTIQSIPRISGISLNSSSSAAPTASAYFAALVTTLQGTLARNETSLNDGDVLPATLYLIAIVIPFVPPTLLRSQSSTPPHPRTPSHAYISSRAFPPVPHHNFWHFHLLPQFPLTRRPALRNAFSTIVEHTIDPRPKVRRKAAEAVRDILSNPPPPLQAHPWRVRVGEWACSVLQTQTAKPDTFIHLLASLKMLVPQWIAREHLKNFATHLLFLPKISHPSLSQAAYDPTSLLSLGSDDIDPDEARETASSVLEANAANPPSKQDPQLAPYWLSALGQASLVVLSPTPPLPSGMDLDTHSAATQIDLTKIWNLPFTYLESTPESRKSAEEAVIQLTQCTTTLLPHPPATPLQTVEGGLTSLAYAPALGNVLRALEGLIMVFAAPWSDTVKKSSAQEYFGDVARKVGEMRVKKGFRYRKGAGAVFSAFA